MPELNGPSVKVVRAAAIVAVVGAIGLVLHQPWLFPSLGPTAMLMLESPEQPSARFVNALVGHLVIVAGLAWVATRAARRPTPEREAARGH